MNKLIIDGGTPITGVISVAVNYAASTVTYTVGGPSGRQYDDVPFTATVEVQ